MPLSHVDSPGPCVQSKLGVYARRGRAQPRRMILPLTVADHRPATATRRTTAMALKACNECGTQISTSAVACPQCGAPNLPPKKRGVISALARWLMIVFVIVPIGIGLFIGVYHQQTHEQGVTD